MTKHVSEPVVLPPAQQLWLSRGEALGKWLRAWTTEAPRVDSAARGEPQPAAQRT